MRLASAFCGSRLGTVSASTPFCEEGGQGEAWSGQGSVRGASDPARSVAVRACWRARRGQARQAAISQPSMPHAPLSTHAPRSARGCPPCWRSRAGAEHCRGHGVGMGRQEVRRMAAAHPEEARARRRRCRAHQPSTRNLAALAQLSPAHKLAGALIAVPLPALLLLRRTGRVGTGAACQQCAAQRVSTLLTA